MQNLKIVTIWSTYGPYHLARVEALKKIGATVICFSYCSYDPQYPFFTLLPENHVLVNNCSKIEIHFFTSLVRTFGLLRKHMPDLVLSCGYERPETLAALLYSKFFSKKVFVITVNQLYDKKRLWIVEKVKSLYLKVFDGFIAGGSTHTYYLSQLGVPSQKIVTGGNCVDNDKINSITSKLLITQNRLSPVEHYFLCVSRLAKNKFNVALIEAYRLYKQKIIRSKTPWKLLIVGDGEFKSEIIKIISLNNLTNDIILSGMTDNSEDIINYYTFSKALILPSNKSERWGLVVNEAMAAHLPVLVSRQCGCSRDLVQEGENGYTFDGNSAEEISRFMVKMHVNENTLKSMGNKSFEIISHWSPDNLAQNVISLYKSL